MSSTSDRKGGGRTRSLPQVGDNGGTGAPAVTDVEVAGSFPSSTKVHREVDGLRVPFRRIQLAGGEPPFDVYDTAGPQNPRLEHGLPKLREPWIERRLAAGDTGNRTQMHYARRGIITEEMQFVALRENMDPEFVRDEIARGRAILPANINHPETEPMIIGKNFLVKINANIGNSAVSLLDRRGGRQAALGDQVGRRHGDGPVDRQAHPRDARVDHPQLAGADRHGADLPVPREGQRRSGRGPQHRHVPRDADRAGRAGRRLLHDPRRRAARATSRYTANRVTGIVSRGGSIMAKWCLAHHKENFLYTEFERICEVMKKYDVAFSLGDGLRPGSHRRRQRRAQFAELETLGELTDIAWKHDVQTMIEGPGHVPMHKIKENVELQLSVCKEAPFYTLGPLVTDIAPGYDHITTRDRRRDDRLVRHRDALLRDAEGAPRAARSRRRARRRHRLQDRRARGRPREGPSRARSSATTRCRKARFEFRWEDQFHLSLDPDTAKDFHDETLAGAGREGRALLLDVRAEVLLDEDHRRKSARVAESGRGGQERRVRRGRPELVRRKRRQPSN